MALAVLLIGAGGHAKAIVEAIEANGGQIGAYVDGKVAEWLDLDRFHRDVPATADTGLDSAIIGTGGTSADQLRSRLDLAALYEDNGYVLPPTVHPAAHVSRTAHLEAGCMVLAGAVVQPNARIGRAAIVNTGAIVEHDSELGEGAHIAPGSVVLGGCRLGACVMVGAGATILPGVEVPPDTLVPANTRFPA